MLFASAAGDRVSVFPELGVHLDSWVADVRNVCQVLVFGFLVHF